MIVRRHLLQLAGAGALLAATGARAEGYPSRSVRVIVPYAPGGPSDLLARLVMEPMGDRLGQQFYIENIAGAGANIGTAEAAKAAHDALEQEKAAGTAPEDEQDPDPEVGG